MGEIRLLFITDPHASTTVVTKAMRQAESRGVDLLLIGGDLDGKYIIFVEEYDSKLKWEDPVSSALQTAPKDKMAQVLEEIARCGGYGVVVPSGWSPASESSSNLEAMLAEQSKVRLGEWIDRLDAFSAESGIKVLMLAGNDDPWDFDGIISKSKYIQLIDERVYEFKEFRFVGISKVPPTPWKTPREISEEELSKRLEQVASMGDQRLPLILMAHIPPYATGLDNAPLLDGNRGQVFLGGVIQTTAVGSKSLRHFIENRTDIVVAFHGHVHESPGSAKLGTTLCLNAGTEYFNGTMVGYYVVLRDGVVSHYERVRN